jgi:hypothetical protein
MIEDIMEETTNLILGTAWNYPIEQIAVFVNSWRQHCGQHPLILLVEPDCSQKKIEWLIDQGVDVRFFSAAYFIPSAIHNTRYFKYLDILLEGRGYYDKVFLCDVRDLAFQGDVFEQIDAAGLHVFLEDRAYTAGTERFNKAILTNNYGAEATAWFEDKPIICSGTTLGDAESILQYIVALMNERDLKKMAEVGGIPDEQACHNWIFHKQKLQHVQHENGDGVATICLTHPDNISIEGDEVIVYGKRPAVIHQWDRHQNLVDHYINLYVKDLKQ